MAENAPVVVAGVDCHSQFHHAVALDDRGRKVGELRFDATRKGCHRATGWLKSLGTVREVGVESSGSYGAELTRVLIEAGISVVEINRPHLHTRHRKGKSDGIDAEAAARQVLAGETRIAPKDTTGVVEAIRQLKVAQDGALKARAAALVQLRDLIVTAPAEMKEALSKRKTLRGRATLCRRLRPDIARMHEPSEAAKLSLRSLARRIATLDEEVVELDSQLDPLVRKTAPRTMALLGVGVGHATQLLITAGQNIDRLRGDSAFAHLCGADPIPASSGKTVRHRLNPGGDRDANSTLHMIAVVRLRYCDRTRAYVARRLEEGRTKREIIRCLKRYIARELYKSLRKDLIAIAQA
ncbi:MAG: IS110 family transposase [Actinobacteria bacterium]|nr:IS110 family transposase [Actinomycetota bacterium]